MRQTRITDNLFSAVQGFYDNMTSTIKVSDSLSQNLGITKCSKMGFELENSTLYTIQFADDQLVIAQSKEDLEYMTRKLLKEYQQWGLTVNVNKTEYMCSEMDVFGVNLVLENGTTIEICDNFKYLGFTFSFDGKDTTEIQNRIPQSKKL